MPRIAQQQPTTTANGARTATMPTSQPTPLPTGGLLDEFIPASQLVDDWMKVCIYGENRTGKTTIACQFPKPLALLATEPNKTGGSLSVTKIPGVFYNRITRRVDALAMAEKLARDNYFKTVVVDSATSLQDIILTEILGTDVPPEMLLWGMVSEDQYRQRSEQCRETLRPFLNLDKHVVILAKQRDHRRQQGDKRPKMLRGFQPESFFAADLGGATAGWLHDACDILLQLYIDRETRVIKVPGTTVAGVKQPDSEREEETGRQVRRLRTMLDVNYAAGLRSATPSVVPQWIQGNSPEEMYADLVRVVRGERARGGKYT